MIMIIITIIIRNVEYLWLSSQHNAYQGFLCCSIWCQISDIRSMRLARPPPPIFRPLPYSALPRRALALPRPALWKKPTLTIPGRQTCFSPSLNDDTDSDDCDGDDDDVDEQVHLHQAGGVPLSTNGRAPLLVPNPQLPLTPSSPTYFPKQETNMKFCNKLPSKKYANWRKYIALLVWLFTIVIWSKRNTKSTYSLNTFQSLSLHCDALGCSLRALWWPGMHCGECASSSCASRASPSCPLCLRLSYTSHGPPTSSQPKKMPLHVMKNMMFMNHDEHFLI